MCSNSLVDDKPLQDTEVVEGGVGVRAGMDNRKVVKPIVKGTQRTIRESGGSTSVTGFGEELLQASN